MSEGDDPKAEGTERQRSELEEGAEHLGRALGGVMTKLLGKKVTGREPDTERPVLGPEADQALDQAGATVGRWLNAAGRALQEHPTSPTRAVEEAGRVSREEPMPDEEGLAPLSVGLKSLGKGLYKTTEAVLDKVAPRKPREPAGEE